MKGNPYAEAVNNGVQNIRELIGKRELYQRDGLGLILESQSRMAVAYELRTANMIALEALLQAAGTDIQVDAIQERLGLQ
jgi:hypothetical protein